MKERDIRIFALMIISAILFFIFFGLLDQTARAVDEIPATSNHIPVPVIDFTYQAVVGQDIILDASQSLDIDGDDLLFLWDLGDGHQSQGMIVTHSYNVIGSYNIILTIIDSYDVSVSSWVINIVASLTNDQDNQTNQNNTIVHYSNDIVINELMPNPAGSDDFEWIELFNPSSTAVDLAGWTLRDASGKKYFINNDDFIDTVLLEHDFFVVPRAISGLTLNNNSETLELLNPDLILVDYTSYDTSAGDNITWVLDNTGAWQWTVENTKGAKNIIKNLPTQNEDDDEISSTTGISSDVIDNDVNSDVLAIDSHTTSTNWQYATSGEIVITEILPAPVGDDRTEEFIEIYNKSDFTVAMHNWRLSDPKTDYIFPDIVINAGEYLLLDRSTTKIALNNTGDVVSLFNIVDELVDSLEYMPAVNNQAYVRDLSTSTLWFWTEDITPGEAYLGLDASTSLDVLGYSAEFNTEQSTDNFLQNIDEINQSELDISMTIQGSVTVLPGEIDSRMIYVSDATGGLQVYMHTADWPELDRGDVLEITGIISQAYGEPRLKIQDSRAIKFITNAKALTPTDFCYQPEIIIGDYLQLIGKIVKKQKPYVDLEIICDASHNSSDSSNDNINSVLVKIRLNDDDFSSLKNNNIIQVTGIGRMRNDSIFLQVIVLEFGADDMLSLQDFTTDEIMALNNPANITMAADSINEGWLISVQKHIYAIILLAIIFIGSLVVYKKNKNKSK